MNPPDTKLETHQVHRCGCGVRLSCFYGQESVYWTYEKKLETIIALNNPLPPMFMKFISSTLKKSLKAPFWHPEVAATSLPLHLTGDVDVVSVGLNLGNHSKEMNGKGSRNHMFPTASLEEPQGHCTGLHHLLTAVQIRTWNRWNVPEKPRFSSG